MICITVIEVMSLSSQSIAGHDDVSSTGGGGEGTCIVKVPGDVPPARVYFFKLSSLAKGMLFINFSPFSPGKDMLFGNLGQRNV